MKNTLFIKLIVKVWPTGNSPIAPGTVCSLLSAILGYTINLQLGSDITLFFGIISGFFGLYFTQLYIESINQKDPKEVVIDEFSGQLIATSAAGVDPLLNFTAFVIFRFFDIYKPGLISKVENFDGALGIMMDDWLAGIYSAFLLFILFLFGFTNYNWFII